MDDFVRCLPYYEKYCIIICVSCQFAVVLSQTKQHLREHHSHLTADQRSGIVESVNALKALAQDEASVVYPSPTISPVGGLPIYHDGLKCGGKQVTDRPCTYVCRSLYGMQKHCRDAHGWINARRRGGDVRSQASKASNEMWMIGCVCQWFFKVGRWQRYFEVVADQAGGTKETSQQCQRAFFRAQEEDVKRAEGDAAEEANRVQGFDDYRSTVVPWLRETGIVDHLRGLKKDEIRASFTLPANGDDGYLRKIVDVNEMLLRTAHRSCFDGPDGLLTWPCRVVLSRFQSSQVETMGSTRAFDPYKEPGTLKSYFRVAHQALVYFDRVGASDDYFFTGENEGEDSTAEDTIEAKDDQMTTWQKIRTLAREEQ